jgi:protein phosphatase/serine/threonine-protein phosphatase Stp1
VQALVESGELSEAESVGHPQGNVITNAIGADSDVLELEKRTGQLVPGDRLLLCSDGLFKAISEEQVAELLSGDGDDGAKRLIVAALAAKATDNVTVVTIEFDADEERTPSETEKAAASNAAAPEITEPGTKPT